ncbi:MAG TPA: hypothetical protein VK843_09255 [Planctomycetota bacterium]|nr:hypothetical protein [Planctomycetota bacterium]
MNESNIPPANDPRETPNSSAYEKWFDGLLDDAHSRRIAEVVQRDPAQRARFEADLATEASLRRSFGATPAARRGPVALKPLEPVAVRSLPWDRYALAASALVVLAAGAVVALKLASSTPEPQGPPVAHVRPSPASLPGSVTLPVKTQLAAVRPHTNEFSLGEVFLDALAFEFQPQVGCQTKDPWDARLFAQLANAPCNQEQGVVVLGEWRDPRVNVANMVMLRRGENPIMLVVPSCELDTDMCVPTDSGLYVHRGVRDGRTIYEISPVPGSEVLSCVDAQAVVTL